MKQDLIPLACAALSALVVCAAHAEDKTDGQWRGTGAAALSATSGNTSTSALLLGADAYRATADDKISLGASINYARARIDGVQKTTANKWGLGGEYDYNLTPQLFAFGKLGLEGDKVIDLSRRVALAGGLGYKLINTPDNTFTLYGGLGYTTDKYGSVQTVGDKTDTTFSRASVYVAEESTHKLSASTAFKQRLDVFPGITGDKALLAKFAAGLSVAMNSTLSLSVGLTDSFNSKPAAGLKKNDIGFFTGVNVKFGAL
jgi:putative salt-induced outer membrane protein